MRAPLLSLTLLLAAGASCTFSPGTGFSRLESASVTTRLDPGEARDLGDGAFLTDQGYRITPLTFTVDLEEARLEELRGGGGETFDPADPPAGYSLCHGGHCHRDDGSLVTYAEVEAALAGDDARFEAVVTLPLSREMDLLAWGSADLDSVEPSRELPMGRLTRLTLVAPSFSLSFRVTGGDLAEGEELSFLADLPLGDLWGPMDLDLDRTSPPAISLEITFDPGGTFLDGLDLPSLFNDGGGVMEELHQPGALELAEALLSTGVAVHTMNHE